MGLIGPTSPPGTANPHYATATNTVKRPLKIDRIKQVGLKYFCK